MVWLAKSENKWQQITVDLSFRPQTKITIWGGQNPIRAIYISLQLLLLELITFQPLPMRLLNQAVCNWKAPFYHQVIIQYGTAAIHQTKDHAHRYSREMVPPSFSTSNKSIHATTPSLDTVFFLHLHPYSQQQKKKKVIIQGKVLTINTQVRLS